MTKLILYIMLSIILTACIKDQTLTQSCEGKFDNIDIGKLKKTYDEISTKDDSFEKSFFLCLIEERLDPTTNSNLCYQDIINSNLKYISSNKDYNETELFVAMLFTSNSKYNSEVERIYKKNKTTLSMIYPNFNRCAVINDYLTNNID